MFTLTLDATITAAPAIHHDGTVTLRALYFRPPGPAVTLTIICTGQLTEIAASLRTGDQIVVTADAVHDSSIDAHPALTMTAIELSVTHRIYTSRHRAQDTTALMSTADIEAAHHRYQA